MWKHHGAEYFKQQGELFNIHIRVVVVTLALDPGIEAPKTVLPDTISEAVVSIP